MRLRTLDVRTWQTLRFALRVQIAEKGKFNGVRGRALRLVSSRVTKSGRFLTDLVAAGLLRPMTGDGKKVEGEDKWAEPFRQWYGLTELGEYAAEYGEYEGENYRR